MSFESLSSGIDLSLRETRVLHPLITLYGNTTATLVKCTSDVLDIVPYVEINNVQPSTSGSGLLFLQDEGANFPTLDSSAAPAVWGLLVLCRDANPLYPPIVEYIATGGVTTTMTLRGTSSTGVTALKNLAFSFSSATADLSGNNTYAIQLRITYKCLAGT